MLNILNISKTQWKIIEALAKANKTQTELSKELKISLAAVNKEIKELLIKNLIKESEKKQAKTRPYMCYELNEFFYFIKALKNDLDSKFLAVNDYLRLHLNIWKIPQQEYNEFIEMMWFQPEIQKNLDKIESMAIFGSVAKGTAREGSDIDVLIVANKKIDMKESLILQIKSKTKIALFQIMQKKEFEESYKHKSKFIEEILKNSIVLYDPNNFLTNIKNEFAQRTSQRLS